MKRLSILVALCVALGRPILEAQSLDIGGIEVRLGQDATTAVQRLSIYRVDYMGKLNQWNVVTVTGRAELLGSIAAREGRITWISKSFSMGEPNDDISAAYTEALREARRRGGDNCYVNNVEYPNGIVAVETRCGSYLVSLALPSKAPDGRLASASVSLQLKPSN